MPPDEGRSPALDALFWREEILQVLFWMQGEKLARAVSAWDVQVLLQGDTETVREHMERGVDDGYLVRRVDDGTVRYALSEKGREEGAHLFSDAFAGMQKQGHGECTPDCDCHWEDGHENCPSHAHHH